MGSRKPSCVNGDVSDKNQLSITIRIVPIERENEVLYLASLREISEDLKTGRGKEGKGIALL